MNGRSRTLPAGLTLLCVSRALYWLAFCSVGIQLTFRLYADTGSAAWVAVMGVGSAAAALASAPMAGRLADRWERLGLVAWADAAVLAPWGLLLAWHAPWQIAAASVLGVALSAPAGAALPAAALAMTGAGGPGAQAQMMGRLGAFEQAGMVAGTVLGGAAGSALALADGLLISMAVTAAASGCVLILRRMHGPQRPAPAAEEPAQEGAHAARAGLLEVWRRWPAMRVLAAAAGLAVAARSFSMLAEAPLAKAAGAGALGLGVLSAAWSAGMIAGALLAARAPGSAGTLIWGRIAIAACFVPLAFTVVFPAAVAAYVAGGAATAVLGVVSKVMTGRIVPDAWRGRAFALSSMVMTAAMAAGQVPAGLLIDAAGVQAAYAVCAAGVAASALVLLAGRRKLEAALNAGGG